VKTTDEPDIHVPRCHTYTACGTVHLSGSTLQTDNGLCKELLGVPMLFATGSDWLVGESVHLGDVELAALKSSHNNSTARGAQVDGHIAAHHP
jgi:hypothetical protein